MVHVEPGWEDFLRQHQRSSMWSCPKHSAFEPTYLGATAGWRAIYSDDVAVAFEERPR